jgi:hypothetical protein
MIIGKLGKERSPEIATSLLTQTVYLIKQFLARHVVGMRRYDWDDPAQSVFLVTTFCGTCQIFLLLYLSLEE